MYSQPLHRDASMADALYDVASIEPGFVATVPQWNTLPQLAVNADTVSAFKTQLRSMP